MGHGAIKAQGYGAVNNALGWSAYCVTAATAHKLPAMSATPDPRRHMPATLRNREAILAVLRQEAPKAGVLLEIASGSGEHAAWMAPQLQSLIWQPSDYEAEALPSIDAHAADSGASNIRPALQIDVTQDSWPVSRVDAILCCNMIHIAPWSAAEGLFAGAARILPAGAALMLYGPFKRNGAHTAPSNEKFDAEFLKARNPAWGVRCLDTEVTPLAERTGFARAATHEMPANNLTVVFRKR